VAATVPLMSPILVDVLLALPPLVVGLLATWRLIWPWWKIPGKALTYVLGVAALAWAFGHVAVLLGWLHQGLGLAFHVWFCRTHGFTWYAVEDPERYVELSKRMVGADEPP